MNEFQVQKALRERFANMTDKQLSEREERATTLVHPITQQSFCEIAAEHFALMTKRNPSSMARIKRVALRYPGLAKELLTHFPGDEDLQDIKDGWWIGPPIPQDACNYQRDVLTYRPWLGRFDHYLGKAQLAAGRIARCDDDNDPAEWHLREERIDALASLLCLFADPDAATACPVANGPEREAVDNLRAALLAAGKS